MKKYRFDRIHTTITKFTEKDHIITAQSLTDAIEKFARKHDLEAPAYWDEPAYDKNIELTFSREDGKVTYLVSW